MRSSFVLGLVAACLLAPSRGAAAGNPLRLRPGARGPICLGCHREDVGPALERRHVHTPVRSRDCVTCHDGHAAEGHELLAGPPGESCARCHSVVPPRAASSHPPAAEQRCTACHDPHGAAFPANLVKREAELCAGCHPRLAGAAARASHPHPPVARGCTSCHDPHASTRARRLLAEAVPALCLRCHPAAGLPARHTGYPVASSRCTGCHDPHGSDRPGMLRRVSHPPMAKRNCSQCHQPSDGPGPFRTRRSGAELCRGCHPRQLAAMLERNRVHRPVAAGDCLACHDPHGSSEPGLLRAGAVAVCGACHADSVARQLRSPTRHPPVAEGRCTACHDPHSADGALLLRDPDPAALCGACHSWRRHFPHPAGPGVRDPRNRNGAVTCPACHRAHGTEYAHLLPFDGKVLCAGCHADLWR